MKLSVGESNPAFARPMKWQARILTDILTDILTEKQWSMCTKVHIESQLNRWAGELWWLWWFDQDNHEFRVLMVRPVQYCSQHMSSLSPSLLLCRLSRSFNHKLRKLVCMVFLPTPTHPASCWWPRHPWPHLPFSPPCQYRWYCIWSGYNSQSSSRTRGGGQIKPGEEKKREEAS